MNDENYVLIQNNKDVRQLVKIPVKGRIEVIGFTRFSSLGGGHDGTKAYVSEPEPNGTYPIISSKVFDELYGKVLTLVDATFPEGSQKEAFKSLIKNEMSGWYDKSTNYTLKMTEQAYRSLQVKNT